MADAISTVFGKHGRNEKDVCMDAYARSDCESSFDRFITGIMGGF